MNKNFVFIEDLSIFKKIFLTLILALSIYAVFTGGLFYGAVLMGIALKFLMQKGVELNLLNMTYRELVSWYGIKFGKWNSLPKIAYLSIFETTKNSRFRAGGGNAAHFSSIIFKLNVFYDSNKHLTLLSSEDKTKVYEIGKNISDILNVKFHMATK